MPIEITFLPYTIASGGSYSVSGNLTGSAGAHGIVITSSHVTLDLLGFELAGVPDALNGIHVAGAVSNIVLRNGTVRGWSVGARLHPATGSTMERIRAARNTIGLVVGDAGTLSDCIAEQNANEGIAAGRGCLIRHCRAERNQLGIATGGGIIDGCVARYCMHGIFAGQGSLVRQCLGEFNTSIGISTSDRSLVESCASHFNTSAGINVTRQCVVRDCTSTNNGGPGIVCDELNLIEGNYVAGNARGIELRSANRSIVVRNTAAGNASNWPRPESNIGPIQRPADASSPWANFVL